MPLPLSFASRRLAPQQRPEPGLLKVVVAGEGIADSFAAHHDERDTVRQAPAFVFVLTIQSKPLVHQGGRRGDHRDAGTRAYHFKRLHGQITNRRSRESVGEFDQHVLRCEQATREATLPSLGTLVIGVVGQQVGE